MRKFYLLLLPLLASPLSAIAPDKPYAIKDFTCGADTYHNPLNLNDCFVQDALNVYFDKTGIPQKRAGTAVFVSSSAYSYSGAWQYTDGNNNIWFIARTSDTIMATQNGTTFSVKIATVSSNNIVNETNALGNAYFVDQTQGVYYWNGTSTTYVNGSPKGNLITSFHGRVFVAGLPIPNGNQLYGSKYLDGTTWSLGINAIDPVQFSVNLLDNSDNMRALFPGFNDTLYLFNTFSIYGLYGFDQTDFQIRTLNREVGCIDQKSMQPWKGGLVFASQRGVEFFDGYTATRISDPIKNKVDPATFNTFSARSWAQTGQLDFQNGVSSPTGTLSYTISPGDIVVSSFNVVENSSAQWVSGKSSNITVGVSSLSLSTNDLGNVQNNGCDTDDSGYCANWGNSSIGGYGRWQRRTTYPGVPCTVNPRSGAGMFLAGFSAGSHNPYTLSVNVRRASDNYLIATKTESITTALCAWNYDTVPVSSAYLGQRVNIELYVYSVTAPNLPSIYTTSSTYVYGGDVGFYYNSSSNGSWDNGAAIFVDDITGGSSTITSGSFTSKTYDIAFTSSAAQIQANCTINTSTPSFSLITATSTNGPWTTVATSSGQNAIVGRYVAYTSTISIGSGDDALTSINSVTIVSYSSSGVYLSAVNYAPNLQSWGAFNASQDLYGGTINYYTRSSSSPFSIQSATPSWTSQTLNGSVAVSTGTYMQARMDFGVSIATQSPALHDFTFNWNEGVQRPSMASAIYDDRYWLSLSTDTTSSTNNATLVLSKGPIWTIFDTAAGAYTLFKNNLYHCDANPTGLCYQDDTGTSDNGRPIDAYIRTKEYAPEAWLYDKWFKTLYISTENQGPYTFTSTYYLDGSTVPFSLSGALQNEQTGRPLLKLPFPQDTQQTYGRTISFKFEQADVNPFRIHGGYLLYRVRHPL